MRVGGVTQEMDYVEKRSEWGILGAQKGNRLASGRKQKGFKKREKRVARDMGEVFIEAASQEPKAETVLTKKEQSMCNGVVT